MDPAQKIVDRHEQTRRALAARYGISGECVNAPTLATIMGLGRTTVHDQVKAGTFPIPHRTVHRKPLFLLDDVVDWLNGNAAAPSTAQTSAQERSGESKAQAHVGFKHADVEDAFLRACERLGLDPRQNTQLSRAPSRAPHA